MSNTPPTRQTLYPNTFDFDEASRAWLRNKVDYGGTYSYVCDYVNQKGEKCDRDLVITMKNMGCTRCKYHLGK